MELVGFLPRGSNYSSAALDDDELIEAQIAAFGKPKAAKRPPLKGWDDHRSDMADLKDLIQHLIAVTARSDKPIRPWPRPENGLDRLEDRQRQENTNWLYDQLGITEEQRAT